MDYRHLERHSQRAQGDAWVARFVVRLPANEGRPGPADVRRVAEEMLKTGGDRGDDRYISIARADLSEVEYHFDGAAWTRDNFGSLNPQFEAPLKLAFRYQNQIPRFIYTSAPVHDLERYIVNLFKQHVERNKRALLGGSAVGQVIQGAANAAVPKDTVVQSMLSQAVDRLFDVELDYQRKRIVAKLSGLGVGIVAAAAQQSASSSGSGAPSGTSSSSASGSHSQPKKQQPRSTTKAATPEMQEQFMVACRYGKLEEVKRLIAAGVDVNAIGVPNKKASDNTPLWHAIYGRHSAVARLLVESGANVNKVKPSTDAMGVTALHLAVANAESRSGTTEMVRYLLDHGADTTLRGSPATYALRPNHPVIEPGDDVEKQKDGRGQTFVMLTKALNARQYAAYLRGDMGNSTSSAEKSRMDEVIRMLGGGVGRSGSAAGQSSSSSSSSGRQASSRSNGSTGSSSSSGRSSSTHDASKSGVANAAGKRQQQAAGDPVSLVYSTPMAERADRILSLPTPKDKEEFLEVLRAAVFGSETIPIETRNAHMKWTGETDNDFAEMEAVVSAWRQLSRRLFSAGRHRFAEEPRMLSVIGELETEFARLTHGRLCRAVLGGAGHRAKKTERESDQVACIRCGNSGQPVKRFNWVLFFVLFMFTSGIGAVIYGIHFVSKRPDRCAVCGAKLAS